MPAKVKPPTTTDEDFFAWLDKQAKLAKKFVQSEESKEYHARAAETRRKRGDWDNAKTPAAPKKQRHRRHWPRWRPDPRKKAA